MISYHKLNFSFNCFAPKSKKSDLELIERLPNRRNADDSESMISIPMLKFPILKLSI